MYSPVHLVGLDSKGRPVGNNVGEGTCVPCQYAYDKLQALYKLGVIPSGEIELIDDYLNRLKELKTNIQRLESVQANLDRVGCELSPAQEETLQEMRDEYNRLYQEYPGNQDG
jgi:exonuclease VII small subunit